jgi:uncharacterized membrane protein YphA (DoxX/SURF4 family)
MTATSHTQTAPSGGRGTAVTVILWIVQVLLAGLFAFAGITKLLVLFPEAVPIFERFGLGGWFMYAIGALELAGGIGLLIPRLSGLSALCLGGIMVGAIITHIVLVPPPAAAVFPAAFLAVLLLVAYVRRSEIKALVAGGRTG